MADAHNALSLCDDFQIAEGTLGGFLRAVWFAYRREIAPQGHFFVGKGGSPSHHGQEPSARSPMMQAVSPSGVNIFLIICSTVKRFRFILTSLSSPGLILY